MLFLLYCLWRFRLGEPFVLGVGEYGIKLAEGGSYGAGNAQQGTANPFGPGYNSNYAPSENTAPVVSTSSARPGANAYPSVPSKGVEGGYQQPYGAGAPSVMEGTYSSHN